MPRYPCLYGVSTLPTKETFFYCRALSLSASIVTDMCNTIVSAPGKIHNAVEGRRLDLPRMGAFNIFTNHSRTGSTVATKEKGNNKEKKKSLETAFQEPVWQFDGSYLRWVLNFDLRRVYVLSNACFPGQKNDLFFDVETDSVNYIDCSKLMQKFTR